jgi:protein TonB
VSISKTQWSIALMVALFVHAVMAAMFGQSLKMEHIVVLTEKGIEINLASAESYIQPEPEPEAETDPDPEPEPELEPEPEPEPEAEPEPEPEPDPEPEPEPEPEAEPPVITPILKPTPQPYVHAAPFEKLESHETAVEEKEVRPPTSAPFVTQFVPPVASEPPAVKPQHKVSPVRKPSLISKGASPQVKQNYYSQLAAWLAKYKEYPFQAKRKRMVGVVRVQFSINKRGDLLDYRVLESSGFDLLDEAALEMLQRANPYPVIPDDLGLDKISIILPVEFSLNRR